LYRQRFYPVNPVAPVINHAWMAGRCAPNDELCSGIRTPARKNQDFSGPVLPANPDILSGMKKDLSRRTLGVIHSVSFTPGILQPLIEQILPEVRVLHLADDSLQRDLAVKVGAIPKADYFKFTTYARFLEEAGADLIVLACSTFSMAVELAAPMIDTPILQIDRPMMDLAVQTGRRVGLIATLPSTIPFSERLLRVAADEAGREISIKTTLCEEAFQELRRGNREKHDQILLAEIDRLSRAVDCICLAQVSMSGLNSKLVNPKVPVLNSGQTGFTRAREILESLTS
jgi:Asp/Glu/hydantoin racemase